MDLNNFEGVKVEDGYLVVRVKAADIPKPSSTGKTLINYTTGRATKMSDDSFVQLTWYKYPPR